jgi:hypothetical protein
MLFVGVNIMYSFSVWILLQKATGGWGKCLACPHSAGLHTVAPLLASWFGHPNNIWWQVVMENRVEYFTIQNWKIRDFAVLWKWLQLPTAATGFRSQVRSCGICGEQNGTEAGFLRVLRFALPNFIPPSAPYSLSFCHRRYIGPILTASLNNQLKNVVTSVGKYTRYRMSDCFLLLLLPFSNLQSGSHAW